MASNASSYFLKIKSTKSGEVKGEATVQSGQGPNRSEKF